jgi:hypothetical protein
MRRRDNLVRGVTFCAPWTLSAQPREDTGLSPAEAVFGAPIVLPNEIFKTKKCQLMLLSKILQKICMFLLFLCPGTILAPSCPASYQASSSPPPSSGSFGAASSQHFSRSMKAPTLFCARPRSSPSESGPGTRSSPSAALRLARPRTLHLAARVAAADHRVRDQAVLPQPRGSRFQAHWFLHLPDWWHHQRCHRRGTRPVNGHRRRGWTSDLFSSRPRPETGGSPVDTCLHPCR